MPLGGALWNREVGVELAQLTEVVAAARTRPLPTLRPKLNPRPGWAADLVCKVMNEAGRPLRPFEIRKQLEQERGEPFTKETVHYVLKFSRLAKTGQILRLDDGTYRLTEQTNTT